MKRIFIPTLFLCLLSLSDAKGQDTLVDKQPQNRAALLEEFTGVNCGYCPAGHVLTNQLSSWLSMKAACSCSTSMRPIPIL